MGIAERDVLLGYVIEASKDKRFVILSMDGDEAYALLISSKLNYTQQTNPAIRRLKMPLESQGRSYLNHDSYLCCETVHTFNMTDLLRQTRAKRLTKIGAMSPEDLYKAKRILWDAGLYNEIELNAFGIFEEDFEEVEAAAE